MGVRTVAGSGVRSPWAVQRHLLCLAVMVVLCAAGAFAPRALALGSTINLGSLAPGCGSSAAAINDLGQVAGTSCDEPFRWTRADGMRGLGALSSLNDGAATAINIRGQVTGWSLISAGEVPHPFVWTPSGGMQDLTPGTVEGESWGQAIDNRGEVAFTTLGYDGCTAAVSWSPSQGTLDLGELNGGCLNDVGVGPGAAVFPLNYALDCCVSPSALNDLGDVTGEAQVAVDPAVELHAYLYTPSGGMQDLGTLPGDVNSTGVAVNDLEQVAGNSVDANGVYRAFRWTRRGGMRELILPGGTSSDAVGINDLGEVAGYSQLANGSVDAFRWTPWGGIRNLGPGQAVAINELGQVAIAGPNGKAYRWTPLTGLQYVGQGTPTAINDWGQITGDLPSGNAFLWTP
jgi:probable HAF family extracellular repeat protein